MPSYITYTAAAQKLLIATLLIWSIKPASAQSQNPYCSSHDILVNQLQSRYSESRSAMAISQNGRELIELFTAKNGDWTLIISNQFGKTCVLGVGKSWVNLPTGTNS